jgi:hypothetical protein
MYTQTQKKTKTKMFSLFWVTAPLTEIVIVNDGLTEIVIE